MTVVFVHGVPDTHRVWSGVIHHLGRSDTIALELPGFGCDMPDGFNATMDDYAAWLVGQLETFEEPVDLVGHDWGGILTLRAASLRPDLIRSFATGGAPLDSTYTWHETAQLWQTPGVGEEVMKAMTPEAIVPGLHQAGLSLLQAQEVADHMDARMKDCILKLYRSAVNIGQDWAPDLKNITKPGLIIWGANDPYVAPSFAHRLTETTPAKTVIVYESCGHWWEAERPKEVAEALTAFWREVGG